MISAVSQPLVSARPVSARFGLLAQGVGATEFQKLGEFKGNDDAMAWARELEAMRKQSGEMS
ncbi:MAG: hypothetical protein KC462_05240, partial [Cyanobacteria bacterium HKST-UBA05]|nr:hypothetical protein [Cyanobacteria bacterium HKST-UBA05]